MNLQLKRLRKEAGYKKIADIAKALGVKERTYASWEREEVGLSMAQACDIADLLDCTLDELAGRWEYVKEPRYSDPRQAALNGHYSALNDEGKDDLVKFAKSFAADPERRALKDSPVAAADTANVA